MDVRRTRGLHTLAVHTVVVLLLAMSSGCAGRDVAATPPLVIQRLGEPLAAGWSLTSPEAVTSAAALGITVDILYDAPPLPTSPLGRALTDAHMTVISAEISTAVEQLECTRTHTVEPPPTGTSPFCAVDPGIDLDRLRDTVRHIVHRDATNPLVVGYWILDDVAAWDVGGLRQALSLVRDAIPRDHPTLCGFSADLDTSHYGQWDGRIAANFDTTYCDAVAPYVYAQPRSPEAPPASYDWGMTELLPRITRSLREHGWDSTEQPLIGVAQAWSGRRASDGRIVPQPRRSDILAQARAYCGAGAIGVAWYAWELSDYPDASTPLTSPSLAEGIRSATGSSCPSR